MTRFIHRHHFKTNPDTELLATQRHTLQRAIGKFVTPGMDWALVDFPAYANVGDSAIWLGAMAMLRDLTGREPVFACQHRNSQLAPLARRIGSGVIFITGGGNLGDLWPQHQRFREQLLKRFPANRIVQLPQSIHFKSKEMLRGCAEVIAAHRDFHLLVRDAGSYATAKEHFACDVHLVPDCAFALELTKAGGLPRHPLLCLLRDDQERRGEYATLAQMGYRKDWLHEPLYARLILRAAMLLAGILMRIAPFRAVALSIFQRAAQRRLRLGIELLSSASCVVTDRLHGHVLCMLLGVPHIILDNSYGKISAYRQKWTCTAKNGLAARDEADAVDLASSLTGMVSADKRQH